MAEVARLENDGLENDRLENDELEFGRLRNEGLKIFQSCKCQSPVTDCDVLH